jgi:dienelactone hydrolase
MPRLGPVARATLVAGTVAFALASMVAAPRYLRAAALVVNASGIEGWPHQLAAWHAVRFRTDMQPIPSRHGVLRARLYRPEGRPRRAVVMAPGMHAGGLDEPRLVDFAGHMASRRIAVLTVELPDLLQYRVTPRTTDMIEDAAGWLAGSGLAPDGRAGIVGISFAGGLSVSAAGRSALRDRVSFVLSLGGHGDLRRTLRYVCTGLRDDGRRQPPHDYGLAIALLAVADRVVPPAQVGPLSDGILTFLEASHLDAVDKARSAATFDRARALERRLPEPAAAFMRQVNARDVVALGSVLLPHIASMADDPALSPELAPAPASPVYLLHGADDTVIPSDESRHLADYLEGQTRVQLLVTPVIRHAEVARVPGLRDAARLVGFWAGALDE